MTQLVVQGRQRIADFEARDRAGNDRAEETTGNEGRASAPAPAVDTGRVAAEEASQPEPLVQAKRKRKRNAAALGEPRSPRSRRKQTTHQKRRLGTGKSAEHAGASDSIRQTVTDSSASTNLATVFDGPSSSESEEEEDRTSELAQVKSESQQQRGNEDLQAKGQSLESAIEVEESEDDDDATAAAAAAAASAAAPTASERSDQQPPSEATPRNRSVSKLAFRKRQPLQSIPNGANVKNVGDKPGPMCKTMRYYQPSGKLHRVPTLSKSRSWQAPYTRQISVAREEIALLDNWDS